MSKVVMWERSDPFSVRGLISRQTTDLHPNK